MKYFEYLKYNIEEVFRVNEVSRRPRAAGHFSKYLGYWKYPPGGAFLQLFVVFPHISKKCLEYLKYVQLSRFRGEPRKEME